MLKLCKNSLSNSENNSISKEHAVRFIDNINKMRNLHIRNCGGICIVEYENEDYYENQEQKDLKNYKRFINSSAYDDIREVESGIGKQLTLSSLRKISSMYDD